MSISRHFMFAVPALGLIGVLACAGCAPADAEPSVKAEPKVRAVPVTVALLERKTIERTITAVGTLRGWEQVTLGSKRSGRVVKVLHDMGDRVQPGEPLIELDTVDAQLACSQAQSKYLAELVKLDITEERAMQFVKKYGITESLVRNQQVDEAIDRVPAVKQMHVAKDKANRNLERERTLSKKGASTPQELEDFENEYRTACADL